MKAITIKHLTLPELEYAGIFHWPIWEKEPSRFDWYYDQEEHCYILQGHVIVETSEGSFEIKAGDYVIFAKGLKCVWEVKEEVRKHYRFG
jgi:uncharacterized protein